jgi:hypothetical protein
LTIVDRNEPTLIYKDPSFAPNGEYALDSLWSNRDTIDIMPIGLATDTLKLSLVIKTRAARRTPSRCARRSAASSGWTTR